MIMLASWCQAVKARSSSSKYCSIRPDSGGRLSGLRATQTLRALHYSLQLLQVGAVVVGFDRYINYYKIQYATLCIRENPGCLFIATNRDAVTHLTDAQVSWQRCVACKGSSKRCIAACLHVMPAAEGSLSDGRLEQGCMVRWFELSQQDGWTGQCKCISGIAAAWLPISCPNPVIPVQSSLVQSSAFVCCDPRLVTGSVCIPCARTLSASAVPIPCL